MSDKKITDELLLAFAAGEVSPERTALVQAHLAESPADGERVARMRVLIETMRTDDSVAPDAETLKRVYAVFQRQAAATSWWESLARVVADLAFDSRATPVLAGLRGEDEAFQLGYESELADVDIQCEPSGSLEQPWHLIGQINLKHEAATVEVALKPSGTSGMVQHLTPDDCGTFAFEASAGAYELLIRVADEALTLGEIELR